MSIVKELDDEEIHGCDICFEEDILSVKTSCGCTTKYCSMCIKNMNNKCCVCKKNLSPPRIITNKINEPNQEYYENLYPYITEEADLSTDKPIQIQVYAVNYNYLRIVEGVGGLLYSS